MNGQSYQLTMRSGPTPGKVFPVEQQDVRLGRDLASDISISDPEVSRHHARFLPPLFRMEAFLSRIWVRQMEPF